MLFAPFFRLESANDRPENGCKGLETWSETQILTRLGASFAWRHGALAATEPRGVAQPHEALGGAHGTPPAHAAEALAGRAAAHGARLRAAVPHGALPAAAGQPGATLEPGGAAAQRLQALRELHGVQGAPKADAARALDISHRDRSLRPESQAKPAKLNCLLT